LDGDKGNFAAVPGYCDVMSVTIHTSLGDLKVELACEQVPKLCFNFLALAASGFYNGLTFHRNIAGFIVQAGDPHVGARLDEETQKWEYVSFPEKGPKGGESIWGGKFEDSMHPMLRHNERGVLSMANKGRDTNGSQFFLTYSPQPQLDETFCVFGNLFSGHEILDKMEHMQVARKKSRPEEPIVIHSMTIHANPLATQ